MKLITTLLTLSLAMGMAAQEQQIKVSEKDEPMETGLFEPTWESLEKNYTVPEWYKNAKFGLWAHWGPQCVEGSGDWMGRMLYMEGNDAYKHHLENYGHPSEFGFKDVLPLFKAENWDPEKLVALYKEVGAQYFVAMANHHDNFDMWDSKYQEWNAKNIGPKRDVLAEWEAAAKKVGLPFGVSIHADHAWTWYETAQRYDCRSTSQKMGVEYDGNLTKEDGKGKWWEGMDPQHLYRQRHPLSKGSWADWQLGGQWEWGNGAATPSQEYVDNFYNRTVDLINRYNPDFIYFDATALPMWPISDVGLKIGAHYYNHNMSTHKGKLQAVMTGKILTDEQKKALVWDVERGAPNEMIPTTWQTCNCLGNWHYNDSYYKYDLYKSAATVVKLLVDVVSKNGNLLLNVPLRGDGTPDEKELKILKELGAWMKVNGESIYSTHPWKIFGEGPIADATIELKNQGFNDSAYTNAGSDEIRFNQTAKYLYVTALAWPTEGNEIKVKSLSADNELYKGKIKSITLLGYGKVKFSRNADALVITLPEERPNEIAPVFKIAK